MMWRTIFPNGAVQHERVEWGAHESGAEVLLDAGERRRLHRHVAVGLELLTVLSVLGPGSTQPQVLARLDAKEVADDGDEVPLAWDGQPHHAPGVLSSFT